MPDFKESDLGSQEVCITREGTLCKSVSPVEIRQYQLLRLWGMSVSIHKALKNSTGIR